MQRNVNERQMKVQFENYFRQYFKPLCFYAMSLLKDEEAARDVVHDVFLSVWVHREEIDFERPMYPYLLNLIRNRALNWLAHTKVVIQHEEHMLQKGELLEEADDNGHEELVQQIMERIDHLPERCSEVMRLCFVECKSYKEIAALLGVSVNTVKTHITNGLKILREEFPASILLFLFLRMSEENIF